MLLVASIVKLFFFFNSPSYPKRREIRIIERFSIAFTANVRLKFPVYQKLVKFIWFQLIFCLLATAMEQVLINREIS